MKTFSLCLAALAAVVTLTAVAAAGREAAKQRVAITSKLYPERTFVLTPLKAGDLMRDSGEVSIVHGFSREVMRDAQGVDIYPRSILTFKGKRGTLTIRERTEWVVVSNENNRFGYPPGVAIGTWKVVRGTGQYAQVTGGGRSGHAGFGDFWLARQEGFHPPIGRALSRRATNLRVALLSRHRAQLRRGSAAQFRLHEARLPQRSGTGVEPAHRRATTAHWF
jgi:hypothetical protein